MGTNYYRIPKTKEVITRLQKLNNRLQEMDFVDPHTVKTGFSYIEDENGWDTMSPWDELTKNISIHLGKRSSGWKFCWNFNNNKFYCNKEELLDFIRKGRVVDEYGQQIEVEDFIEMALNWGQPDGLVVDKQYYENNERSSFFNDEKYYDKDIDGLRVSSSTEFS